MIQVYREIPGCNDIMVQFYNEFNEIPIDDKLNKDFLTFKIENFFDDLKKNLEGCQMDIQRKTIKVLDTSEIKTTIRPMVNYFCGFAALTDEYVKELFKQIDDLEQLINTEK